MHKGIHAPEVIVGVRTLLLNRKKIYLQHSNNSLVYTHMYTHSSTLLFVTSLCVVSHVQPL